MAKQFISTRRSKLKTHRVWRFSMFVLSLAIALIVGALIERNFGHQNVVVVNQTSQESQSVQQNRNMQALLEQGLTQLSEQVTDLTLKTKELEAISERIKQTVPFEKKEGQTSLLPHVDNEGGEVEEKPSEDSGVSAEKIGHELDLLRQKISMQEDLYKTMDVLLVKRTVHLNRIPTAFPVHLIDVRLSSTFGYRHNPVTGRYVLHEGVDFAGPRGTPIYAASAGVVSKAGWENGYGNVVEIDHGDGVSTRYAHLSEAEVKEGDIVTQRQRIARMGSTGNSTGSHLHFEIRLNHVPIDPLSLLGQDPMRLKNTMQETSILAIIQALSQ